MTRPPMLILAGGKGTRLGNLTANCQKCMVPVQGVPFLSLLVNHYRKQGFDTFIILTGCKAEQVESYDFGPGVSFKQDPWEWPTDIAISSAASGWELEEYWVCNGDTWIFDPLPFPKVTTITVYNDKDAGAYYQSSCGNRTKVHAVNGFIDIGTHKGLERFKHYYENNKDAFKN